MATTSTTGSTLLQPLSNVVQLPIDQVNFVVCQLFALLAAIWFRTYLHSSKTSSFIRHVVATLLGLYLALFCFGWYALHFLVQSGISYCIMIIIGVENMHKYCFVFALGYLTVCQITRVYIFDYGQYSADFSGPMMIITQKITSLAYEIHDGMFRKDEELTPSQRGLAVRRMPSLLEYLSYNCNFMGILAGPLCSYKDYITFIEGRSYHMTQAGEHGEEEIQYEKTEPSPNIAVIQKLLVCGLSLLFHLTISKTLPVEYNIDEHFQATASWPAKVIYLYVSLLAARPKYYFAWTLADAINNAAGFGFRGYDKNGAARWDLISNLRIQQIEMRNNFRHHFIEPPQLKLLYDVITWIATQIAVSYTVVPFVLLSIKPSFMFYSSWYYSLHSAGILVLLLLPVKKTQRGKNIHENIQLSRSKKFDERENSLGQNSFSTTNNVCNQNQEIASRHSSLKQ
ncbi:lysophospholipid acyltransferase 2 isoform X3 [Physeter macrocephalus]|uniref:Lysophospholipid acyltransferase 2 isoform X3 n=1 Tax=Physeter macrocephalus TaxID=9755 RepID=A0A9W2X0L9_PHYMC|nr:lysophospholipid acyltransferase 2 isoform X3 [Physeter catodon]